MERVFVLRRQTNINNGDDEWCRVMGGDCLVVEGESRLLVVLLLAYYQSSALPVSAKVPRLLMRSYVKK